MSTTIESGRIFREKPLAPRKLISDETKLQRALGQQVGSVMIDNDPICPL